MLILYPICILGLSPTVLYKFSRSRSLFFYASCVDMKTIGGNCALDDKRVNMDRSYPKSYFGFKTIIYVGHTSIRFGPVDMNMSEDWRQTSIQLYTDQGHSLGTPITAIAMAARASLLFSCNLDLMAAKLQRGNCKLGIILHM